MLVLIGFLSIVLVIGAGLAYRLVSRRKMLLSLHWKQTSSHYVFVKMCKRYLLCKGWELKEEPEAGFDLKMTIDGKDLVLFCHSAGWKLGTSHVGHVGWLERLHRAPIVIVMEDVPAETDYGLAESVRVKLIHYSELGSLQRIAAERRAWLQDAFKVPAA